MGPVSYQNWKAKLEGHPPKYALEFPLFTDAHITGQIEEGYGPYQFFNTIAIAPSKTLTSSIILRVEDHLPEVDISKLKMIKTDTDHYHGGWLSDEVAALLSLCLGIRAKAGGSTRRFELNGDPRGRPEHYTMYSNPVSLPKLNRSPILPFSFGPHLLNDAIYLQRLPEISAQEAMALVRAARLYQDAIWVSESEPALAWLMFVSSIETAADYWRKENLKKSLRKIYDWRYRSLHGGIPFPLPMCEPPFVHQGRFAEKPIGLASQAHGATWIAEDTPMLLHTFEYIVRKSLLSWWNSMIKN